VKYQKEANERERTPPPKKKTEEEERENLEVQSVSINFKIFKARFKEIEEKNPALVRIFSRLNTPGFFMCKSLLCFVRLPSSGFFFKWKIVAK